MNKRGSTLAITVIIVAVIIIVSYSIFTSLKLSSRILNNNDKYKENFEIADMASSDILNISNITANYILEEIVKRIEIDEITSPSDANYIFNQMIFPHIKDNCKFSKSNVYFLVSRIERISEGSLTISISESKKQESNYYFYFECDVSFRRGSLESRILSKFKIKKYIFLYPDDMTKEFLDEYKAEDIVTRESWEER